MVAACLSACATTPSPESPIERAQRELRQTPPVLVAEGCLYYRVLLGFNHYLQAESRSLARDASKRVAAELGSYGVSPKHFAAPLMCASSLPPRALDAKGLVAARDGAPHSSEAVAFPIAFDASLAQDATLVAAYQQVFAACDSDRYRRERRYDCPLLGEAQAALLRKRLATDYLLALSVGGDHASAAHKTGTVGLGLLLGYISIPRNQATARLRLVDLRSGHLVWSSFSDEFIGRDPGRLRYEIGEGGKAAERTLIVREGWEKKLLKTLFAAQR